MACACAADVRHRTTAFTRRRPSGRMATLGDNLSASTKIGYSFLCVALVLFAGLMSGLTLGLLSLDRVELEVREPARADAAARRSAASTRHDRALSGALRRRCIAGAGSQRHRRAEATSCHGHTGAAARRCRGRAAGGEARRHIGGRLDASFSSQLVKKGHQLLVTLLLMNAAAMEVRPIAAPRRAAAALRRCGEPRSALTRAAHGAARRRRCPSF